MTDFTTQRLPVEYDAVALDGSEGTGLVGPQGR